MTTRRVGHSKPQAGTRWKLQKIVRLEALGKTQDEIAEAMGLSKSAVSQLTNTPDYVKLHETYVKRMFSATDHMIQKRSAGFILENAAPDAADALVELLASDDEITQRLSATAILDRAGHGPVQRRAIKQRIELDPVMAEMLTKAMRESAVAVEVLDAEPVE